MKRLIIIGLIGLGLVLTSTKLDVSGPVVPVITYTQPEPNPYHKLYEEMLYPVVRIETSWGAGSGVVITIESRQNRVESWILTAAHVVGDESTVQVEFFHRQDVKVAEGLKASVLITDTNKDLALLCAPGEFEVKAARLAPRDYQPYLFTPVWTVGCSLGLKPRPSYGHLCALAVNFWEISAPVLPGNSGGGVFDGRTYELIGIVVWVRTYHGQLITTMAGVVPVSVIYDFIEKVGSRQNVGNSPTYYILPTISYSQERR